MEDRLVVNAVTVKVSYLLVSTSELSYYERIYSLQFG